MDGQKLEEVQDQCQVPEIQVQVWYLFRRSPHQDHLSNSSDSQIKQDLAIQHLPPDDPLGQGTKLK